MSFADLTVWSVTDDTRHQAKVSMLNVREITQGLNNSGTFIKYFGDSKVVRVVESPNVVEAAHAAAMCAERLSRLQELRDVMADLMRTEMPAILERALDERGLGHLDLMSQFGLNGRNQAGRHSASGGEPVMSGELVGPPAPALHH
jgi:hypothetical protein